MPFYVYKARNLEGRVVSGVFEAESERAVLSRLRSLRFTPIFIREKRPSIISKLLDTIGLTGRVGLKSLMIFSRQLSTLVNAGIPIVQSLNILIAQIDKKGFRDIIATVRSDIERGSSIADALSRHPKAFSELYVAMVRSGEAGGVLDEVLERLSSYFEALAELRGKIISAMAYPAIVVLATFCIVTFILTFVVPTFEEIFASFGAELPLPTRILMGVSRAIRENFLIVGICIVGLFIGFRFILKTEKGKLIWDKFLLKIPLFGPLFRKAAIAKFARTLSTLVKSGVPILEALEIVAKTSGNKVIEGAVMDARIAIREGERIAEPLKDCDVFPPMVIQMVGVGEETGSLDLMLSKIADFYDREVDAAIATLSSMIEPILIVFLGIICGAIIIALFIPILTLSHVIGTKVT
jgi:type IV pilus assembly protein PilC